MKSQLKTIEASISAIILLSFLVFLFSFSQSVPELESLNLKLSVMKALQALDKNNELRQYVYANDTKTIEDKLYPYIPRNYNFKVLICKNGCNYSIEAKNIFSVSYFLSTDLKNFEEREVAVYVWEE
jgi:hypothetical protein